MRRFILGDDRTQFTSLPECPGDYVGQDNPAPVVEAHVEQLDLRQFGFEGIDPLATGRPSYHPALLLKICIYGYPSRIQSSRGLEHETQRRVELMWRIGRLMPDFKTIADFREASGPASAPRRPPRIMADPSNQPGGQPKQCLQSAPHITSGTF